MYIYIYLGCQDGWYGDNHGQFTNNVDFIAENMVVSSVLHPEEAWQKCSKPRLMTGDEK